MMGSAKITTIKSQHTMAEKKSIKSNIKKTIQSFFNKDKKKNKIKNDKNTSTQEKVEITDTLDTNDDGNKTTIHDDTVKSEPKDDTQSVSEDEELKNFCFKVISDVERNGSESSHDSGFAESLKNYEDDVIGTFENLKIKDNTHHTEDSEIKITKQLTKLNLGTEKACDDKNTTDKKKKLQTIVVSRGPIRHRIENLPTVPYSREEYSGHNLKQISQVNRQTFSGGQVIVNVDKHVDNLSEITDALDKIDKGVEGFSRISNEERTDIWEIAAEYISEQSKRIDIYRNLNLGAEKEAILADIVLDLQESYPVDQYVPNNVSNETTNPIDEFSNVHEKNDSNPITFNDALTLNEEGFIFPTPPRSENVPSPISPTFYTSPSEYSSTFSPERSSPMYNSDLEKYQEIVETPEVDQQKRERKISTSMMTMKQYKDLQKEIAAEFSRKPCCKTKRATKEVFRDCMEQLSADEMKGLCVKTGSMDLKNAEGVLQHVLINLPKDATRKNTLLTIFYLICERVLAQKPDSLLGDLGLSLLKSAVLHCYKYPIVTQYLVDCIRIALKSEPSRNPEETLFTEVDALGDNLIIACARAGDALAEVLSLLVAEDAPKLFDLKHYNAEGYSALHVACSAHSATSSRLHIVHVLLTHADIDIWRGDIKGGDTAVHFAVNSVSCDLKLLLVLFRHLDRSQWKKLAHVANRSSVTPLEYARSATKSASRQNYPPEVLEFLKKCR